MGREKEEKLCRIAAFRKKVKLPDGIDLPVFGRNFYNVVRRRMNKLWSNAHGAAKSDREYIW